MEYVDAPMPFIIGVPRNLWKIMKKQKNAEDWKREISIFDIDKKKFVTKDNLPELPIKDYQKLIQIFLQIDQNKPKNSQDEKEVNYFLIKVSRFKIIG